MICSFCQVLFMFLNCDKEMSKKYAAPIHAPPIKLRGMTLEPRSPRGGILEAPSNA
jgi:hypothetical protein